MWRSAQGQASGLRVKASCGWHSLRMRTGSDRQSNRSTERLAVICVQPVAVAKPADADAVKPCRLADFRKNRLGLGSLTQLFQGLGFDLTNPFFGDTEGRADLFECLGIVLMIETVAADDDGLFP
jgi:hypothetical protein